MDAVFDEVYKLLEVSWWRPHTPVRVGVTLHMPGVHLPSSFQCPHMNVRKAAYEALGQFCCALHKACQRSPSDANSAGEEETLAGWEP